MQTHELIPHPDHPPGMVRRVAASLSTSDRDWIEIRWRIEGVGGVCIPPFGGRRRADGLWETTCFELFARVPGDDRYREFNFSPSERWAAYEFSNYRGDRTNLAVPTSPVIAWRGGRTQSALFDVVLPGTCLPTGSLAYGLTAVIEEQGGRISYWAIAHADGKADFHHPACFAGRLPARDGA